MQGRPSWDDQFRETESERNDRLRRKRLAAKCPHCTGNPVIGRPHDPECPMRQSPRTTE